MMGSHGRRDEEFPSEDMEDVTSEQKNGGGRGGEENTEILVNKISRHVMIWKSILVPDTGMDPREGGSRGGCSGGLFLYRYVGWEEPGGRYAFGNDRRFRLKGILH